MSIFNLVLCLPVRHMPPLWVRFPWIEKVSRPGNLPKFSYDLLAAIEELQQTGKFDTMSKSTDEDEHSIEMHLPYIRKVFEGEDIKIVPILVGSLRTDAEATFGALLAPYLEKEDTFTVVSSDFCHWCVRIIPGKIS